MPISRKSLFFSLNSFILLTACLVLWLHYAHSHQLLQSHLKTQAIELQNGYYLNQNNVQSDLLKLAHLLRHDNVLMQRLAYVNLSQKPILEYIQLNWDDFSPLFDYRPEFIDFIKLYYAGNGKADIFVDLRHEHIGLSAQWPLPYDEHKDKNNQPILRIGSSFEPLLHRLDKLYGSGFAILLHKTARQSIGIVQRDANIPILSVHVLQQASRSDMQQILTALPALPSANDFALIENNTVYYLVTLAALQEPFNQTDAPALWVAAKDVSVWVQEFWQQQYFAWVLIFIGFVFTNAVLYYLIFRTTRLLEDKTHQQHQQISLLKSKINDLVWYDAQTTLYNKRYFNQYLEQEISRCSRTGAPLSVLILGIDNYVKLQRHENKLLNQYIKILAALIKTTLRDVDMICYHGTGVFCAALIETERNGASTVTQRLHQLIQKNIFPDEKQANFNLTVSIGVAQWQEEIYEIEFLEQAAQALKTAQTNGGNQVCVV